MMFASKCGVIAINMIPILKTNSMETMTYVQILVYFANYFYVLTQFHPILHTIILLLSIITSERIKKKLLKIVKKMKIAMFNNKFITTIIEKYFEL